MPRYKATKETPISEIVAGRMQRYATETNQATQEVYNSQDFALIDAYERALGIVIDLGRQRKTNQLEALAGKATISPEKQSTGRSRGGRRSDLTPEAYIE